MSKNFFNSNKERGQQLAASEKKALTQNELILKFFKDRPDHDFTAWEVYEAHGHLPWPLTSVRRACTTLCKAGEIIETEALREGGYGKDNRVYMITKKGLNYKR